MEEPKLKFKVLLKWPRSFFQPGDVLEQSSRIPEGCVGKFIDETTGWAWVENPLEFPDVLEPMWKEYMKESGIQPNTFDMGGK